MKAKDVMTSPVITVGSETPLKEVAVLLREKDIGAVPVVGPSGHITGMVSEADLVILEATEADEASGIVVFPRGGDEPATAGELMTRDIVAAREEAAVSHLARLMVERRVGHIPILSPDDRPIGMVSRHDLLRVLCREDAEIREELASLLSEEGLTAQVGPIAVSEGMVTIPGWADHGARRMVHKLARTVPGVIAIRFGDYPATDRQLTASR